MEKKLTDEQVKSVDFEDLLGKLGTTAEAICKIYSGKDHACRCGCKGNYYETEDKSYIRILNAVKRAFIKDARLQEVDYSILLNGAVEYINIPNGKKLNDHCYCIYFKN